MYEDYEDEGSLDSESIVTVPAELGSDAGDLELAVGGMVALERNAWARHAWRANDRAYDRLLEDCVNAEDLRRAETAAQMRQFR